jgi:hypothetical protein
MRGGAILTPDGGFDMDVVFAKPLQVSVAMQASYAAELFRQLRGAKKPRRGECHQISVDCLLRIAECNGTVVAGKGEHAGRVACVVASTILSLIRRGLLLVSGAG